MNFQTNWLGLLLPLMLHPAAQASVPSHCLADEVAVVNAWMGPMRATAEGYVNARSGKFLSVCADRAEEPFQKLVYRYGAAGQVELEEVASPTRPFAVFSRPTGRHMGQDLVYFSKGPITYYVAIAVGQGNGVSLKVFDRKKLIVDRFSGNAEGEDFSLGPAQLDVDRPRSPVVQQRQPPHAF
ncbi:MAG: hypothetical protein U1E77_14005 [Inhella sp.]